jgi:hypothetical protein
VGLINQYRFFLETNQSLIDSEDFKYIRSMLRESSTAQRDSDEEMLEHRQQRLEQLISGVHFLHAEGSTAVRV